MTIPKLSLTLAFSFFPANMKILLGKNKTKSGSVKKLVLAYLCLLYIINSGNTETNPGPHFPCKICEEECNWSRYAVQMESC